MITVTPQPVLGSRSRQLRGKAANFSYIPADTNDDAVYTSTRASHRASLLRGLRGLKHKQEGYHIYDVRHRLQAPHLAIRSIHELVGLVND